MFGSPLHIHLRDLQTGAALLRSLCEVLWSKRELPPLQGDRNALFTKLGRLWVGFGPPLGRLWPPSGAAFRPTFQTPGSPLVCLWVGFGRQAQLQVPTKKISLCIFFIFPQTGGFWWVLVAIGGFQWVRTWPRPASTHPELLNVIAHCNLSWVGLWLVGPQEALVPSPSERNETERFRSKMERPSSTQTLSKSLSKTLLPLSQSQSGSAQMNNIATMTRSIHCFPSSFICEVRGKKIQCTKVDFCEYPKTGTVKSTLVQKSTQKYTSAPPIAPCPSTKHNQLTYAHCPTN
jgi:hypothetical protein